MNARTPRHRGQRTPEQRKRESQAVLALIAVPLCLGLVIGLATVWDAWPTAIGRTIGAFIGT